MVLHVNDQQLAIILQSLECVEDLPVGFEAIDIGDTETCASSERCDQFMADVKDIKSQIASWNE